VSDKNVLPGSFDARDWATEFMHMFGGERRKEIDHELMVCWFANAIMAGYDRRESEVLRHGLLQRIRDWRRTIWLRRLLKRDRKAMA
jgi:hypothetical protein